MFPTVPRIPLFAAPSPAEALETWRSAAGLVGTRWQLFLEAEAGNRSWAFASYLAALDAEEAAAVDLSALSTSLAA